MKMSRSVVLFVLIFFVLIMQDIFREIVRTNPPSLVCFKREAQSYPIPGGQVTLYPDCPTNRLSVAMIDQDGRYPEIGKKVNAHCTEAILVLEGNLTITLGSTEHQLGSGDLVYITPGTPYSVSGKGRAAVFIEPKWDKNQNTAVP